VSAPARTFVAGHRGMVGSAIVRALERRGHRDILARDHAELDLTSQSEVREFFAREKPARVYLAAGKVGGIHANNTYPADFIYENLMIEANVIHEAWRTGVERMVFLGSSCIYPRMAPQPMAEGALLTGPLEPTNEPYAVAKIAGIKLCEAYNRQHGADFRSVMPTNLYGPGDNYHGENSHVIPALIRRFHEARESGAAKVTIWGTGTPRREFLYVDDLAEACVHVMDLDRAVYEKSTDPRVSHINVGTGEDLAIAELAQIVKKVVGFKGEIAYDTSRPDGTPRKLMDASLVHSLGWKARTGFEEGLATAYRDFLTSVRK
jgi:GDP-L-fucose synthase